MHKAIYILSLCLFVIPVSCSTLETQREQLKTEVDEVHNEAMEQMGTLIRLQKELTQMADSLRADTLANQTELIQSIEGTVKELKEADIEMMDWMHRFNETLSGPMPPEEEIEFLEKEKKTMEEVHEDMKEAINHAETLITRITTKE